MDRTLRRLGQSKFIKVLLAVVLVLGLWPAGQASAASPSSFTSYELGYNLIQDKSWTISSNNAHDTTSGEVAYCYTWGKATPTTSIGYTAAGYANNATAVIIDYGYPNNTKINGVQLTSTEARQATQVAIWCVTKSKNNKQSSTSDI